MVSRILLVFPLILATVQFVNCYPQWNNDRRNGWQSHDKDDWGSQYKRRRVFDAVFSDRYDGQQVARCPRRQRVNWRYQTWTIGGIRPYYENKGPKRNFDDCLRHCERDPACYFATYTRSRTCYFLTTDSPQLCDYMRRGHFGALGERCTNQDPCPSAYKQCSYPRCELSTIQTTYCKTNNPERAVETCS